MKRQHPIRKLSWAVQRCVHGEADTVDCAGIERAIARHVKPLLDALDTFGHSSFHTEDPDRLCEVCRLLAEWRAKL